MGRLVLILFIGPWWVRMVVAAGFVWLGLIAAQENTELRHAREALIHQAPPAVIPVAELKRDRRLPLQEVSIRAVIASEHNSHLVEKRNFVTTNEDMMYVLQDETAGVDEPLVRGVVMIEPSEKEAFVAWVIAHAVDVTETGPVVELNGLVGPMRNVSHSGQVLREAGLIQAPDFFQLEPFVIARASALEQMPHDKTQLPWAAYGIAALFALIGLGERRKARRAKAVQGVMAEVAPPAPKVEARFPTPSPARQPQASAARFDLSPSTRLILALGVILVLTAVAGLLLGHGPTAPKTEVAAPPVWSKGAGVEIAGALVALAMIPVMVVWKLMRLFRPGAGMGFGVKGLLPLLIAIGVYVGFAQLSSRIEGQPMPGLSMAGPSAPSQDLPQAALADVPKMTLPNQPLATLAAPGAEAPVAAPVAASGGKLTDTLPPALGPGLLGIGVLLLVGFLLRNIAWRPFRRTGMADDDPWNRILRERLR